MGAAPQTTDRPARPAPGVRTWALGYVVAAVVFTLVDLVWLTVIADDLYADQLGDLLADPVRPGAAVAFYALFIAGIVHFVVLPALARDSLRWAVGSGAFFGLVTYATWDLTSLAVIEGFPASIVPIDLAWGAFIAATVSAVTTAVLLRYAGDGGRRGADRTG
jgi:uncharacterized membrane protein